MKFILVTLLKVYKAAISPPLVSLFGNGCKYEVSCSEFAIFAITKDGVLKGSFLAFKRFLSCNNFGLKLSE